MKKPNWAWWQKVFAWVILPKDLYVRWRDYGVK